MSLIERTRSFLTDNLHSLSNSTLLLAVSGGPDSMCLLTVLNEIQKNFEQMVIRVAHLDHSLHEMSHETEKLVRDWCAHLNVSYIGASLRNSGDLSRHEEGLEASARSLRYDYLTNVARSLEADAIVTAHHFDDQVETVLLNLGRGSGPYGLQGMKLKNSDFDPPLLRPFLNARKEELLAFVEERNIPFVNDPTNQKLNQARNRIRHTILPEWNRALPDPAQSIHRLSGQAERENDFWREYLENNVKSWCWENEIQVDLYDYRNQHQAVKFRFLHSIPLKLSGNSLGWSEDNFESIHNLFTNSQSGKMIHLPDNFIALREYDRGVVTTNPLEIDYDFDLDCLPFKKTVEGVGRLKISGPSQAENDNALLSIKLDPGTPGDSTIRTWNPGQDKLSGTSDSLKDLFDKNRIPYRARRRLPLVTNRDQVLAIPGLHTMVNENEDEYIRFRFFSDHPCFHKLRETTDQQ